MRIPGISDAGKLHRGGEWSSAGASEVVAPRPVEYDFARRAPLDVGCEPAAPERDGRRPHSSRTSSEDPVSERPTESSAEQDYAARNGWDRAYEVFDAFELPTYVGLPTFMNLPLVPEPAEIRRREVDVAIIGAPFDDAVSHRPGARFGPRAIREAQYTSGSIHSLQQGNEPFEILTVVDAGDANIVPAWIDRSHAMIYRKILEVAETGAIPIVLGGDHSITWPSATAIAEVRRPGTVGIVHFDAHADTAMDDWGVLAGHGTPMRRLIESGAVKGRNFVQVGLRGYWPPVETFQWMQEQGLRYHFMKEIEERGAEAVVAQAIDEALDGPDLIYLSLDIDVIDPGLAPGTGTPEPGGMLTREVLRAIRQIVGAVDLAGMDIVEVSPPYDHAETTAMAANRAALEAISALAARHAAGKAVRWAGRAPVEDRFPASPREPHGHPG
jgi:agmatinase